MSRILITALSLPMALLATVAVVSAQTLPDPPSTVTGSITDAAADVPAGVRVEAYVRNKLCGESETVYTGDGDARVTVYVVDVVSNGQTTGCGVDGDPVRIKVGDRLSPKATVWEAGLVRFDIVFGENVTPKPIPTFTPTTVPTITPTPTLNLSQTTTPGGSTTGTATAGSSASANGSASPESTSDGVASSTPAPPSSGDGHDGGFPVWGAVVLAVIGLGLVGGGVGIYLARRAIPV